MTTVESLLTEVGTGERTGVGVGIGVDVGVGVGATVKVGTGVRVGVGVVGGVGVGVNIWVGVGAEGEVVTVPELTTIVPEFQTVGVIIVQPDKLFALHNALFLKFKIEVPADMAWNVRVTNVPLPETPAEVPKIE